MAYQYIYGSDTMETATRKINENFLDVPTPESITAEAVAEAKEYTDSVVSNRNLLINWDFTNPVNQRGQTTYTGGGAYSYTIDRWRLRGVPSEIEIVSNGVVVKKTAASGYVIFEQIFDVGHEIEGKIITASAIVGGELIQCTSNSNWTFPDSGDTNIAVKQNGNINVSILAYPNNRLSIYFYLGSAVPANTAYTISKTKIELGEISTLLNDPPQNPNEELIKCLPYGELIGKGTWCKAYGNGSVHICVPFRVYKRAKPTINLLTTTLAFYGMTANTNVTLTGVTSRGNGADQYGLGFMYIEGTADTNFVKGAMYGLQNNYVFADAEIYP